MNAARNKTLLQWSKSSYSSDSFNCVEIALLAADQIGVRDSKDPDGSVLSYAPDAWREFVGAIRSGALSDNGRP